MQLLKLRFTLHLFYSVHTQIYIASFLQCTHPIILVLIRFDLSKLKNKCYAIDITFTPPIAFNFQLPFTVLIQANLNLNAIGDVKVKLFA